jgi:PAS domain S-box-containing protein
MVNAKGGRVLIIEDDAGVARLQQRRLERAGYTVISAGAAEEGMEKLAQGGVELILLDYRLPGNRTGLDVYAELKAARHDIPVIMVTGFSDEATVIKALRAGVRDFVTKSAEYLDYIPEAVERVLKQVRTERQLAQSEGRLAGIISSAMDGIVTMDHEGRIIEFNPAAEKIFGYQRSEVCGKELAELIVPPQYRSSHRQGLARYLLTGEGPILGQHLELSALRADGSEFPAELTVTRVGVEGPPIFTAYIRDITERKLAEQRVREQAALINQATNAILVRDLEDRVRFWNHGAERLYGWTATEAIGRNANDFLFKLSSPAPDEASNLLTERGEWNGELRQVTKGGKEVIVESHWTLMRDDQGRPKSTLVINTDITAKKKLEAQFLRAQRMESIGTLAGGIAHDLNNVFTPIIMGLDLLKMYFPDSMHLSLIEPMETSAAHGADMVKQILSFARGIEGQRIELQLKHVIRDIDKMLQHSLPKSIELSTLLPNELWAVSGDATQLYQVLMNLSINARDAMPGGGRLMLAAANVVLDEKDARLLLEAAPGPYVLLTVADTGTGITDPILEKIFDPFFTTKEPGKGTGLGLSTTLGIVKSHGGFIQVESVVGKGTCFLVYLPAVPAAPSNHSNEFNRPSQRGQGELILVVDDEAAIREMIRVALEAHGYRVLTARDGSEAVALYSRHQREIQVVLTDMMMPVMDGPGVVRALQKLDPQVQIITMTGIMTNAKIIGMADLEVQASLTKPVTADKLLTTLAEILDSRPSSVRLPFLEAQPATTANSGTSY